MPICFREEKKIFEIDKTSANLHYAIYIIKMEINIAVVRLHLLKVCLYKIR